MNIWRRDDVIGRFFCLQRIRIIRNKQRKICISGRKVVFLRQNLVKIKIHYNEYFVQMA